jgi:hypothetical protein
MNKFMIYFGVALAVSFLITLCWGWLKAVAQLLFDPLRSSFSHAKFTEGWHVGYNTAAKSAEAQHSTTLKLLKAQHERDLSSLHDAYTEALRVAKLGGVVQGLETTRERISNVILPGIQEVVGQLHAITETGDTQESTEPPTELSELCSV